MSVDAPAIQALTDAITKLQQSQQESQRDIVDLLSCIGGVLTSTAYITNSGARGEDRVDGSRNPHSKVRLDTFASLLAEGSGAFLQRARDSAARATGEPPAYTR